MKNEKIKKNIKNETTIQDEELKKNEELVNEVLEDFKARQQLRKSLETNWQLNINFFVGNQYATIDGKGEIVDNYKQYFWEEREVYNHIAPLIELRLSKLGKARPSLTVLPFSDETKDIASAKVSKKILKAVSHDINLSKLLTEGTMWSEICGTVFYKIGWNDRKGRVIAKNELGIDICEGDIDISVVSPFEIYPDSNTYAKLEDCNSIIYARTFSSSDVKSIWGVDVEGKIVNVFSLENVGTVGGLGYNATSASVAKTTKKDQVVVLEKYESPSVKYPNGRLIIIAGDKLVYVGELPYINMSEGKRGFPFVRQCSIPIPNSFWGLSIVDRCIPIQRAYNAIKNRKHEYLNRLTMGILAVEDGSIDTEDLEEEGLSPGKVLIYRQGASVPRLLSTGSVPLDFQYEENQLLTEFLNVSGVNDLLNSKTVATNISGIALQLLIEQDESRLLTSAEEIRVSAKEISKHILRLYKQFAVFPHSTRIVGEDGGIEMFYWKNSDISADDIVFETESEINETLAQKRSMILDILNTGLLHDENGKLSNSVRAKILEQLGMGISVLENEQDIKNLQIKQATKENLKLVEESCIELPKEIDDHEVHISTHIGFMLSNEFERASKLDKKIEKKLMEHIKNHKQFANLTKMAEELKNLGDK